MRLFKLIVAFYINSSIHVALSVVALTWLSYLAFDLPLQRNVLYFLFFSTVTGYNFVKYFGLARFHYRRLTNKLKWIQIFSGLMFVGLIFYFFSLKTLAQLLTLCLAVITFLYATPFLPKRFLFDAQQNLRQISGIKIYVIAVVWTLSTVIIPVINVNYSISTDVLIVCIQRFLFVLVLMLPFEIRDLNYDSLKLATIPQSIGINNTKILGCVLLIFFLALEFLRLQCCNAQQISTLLITVLTFLFVMFTKKHQGQFYASFWVESLPIWWLIMRLIFG